jgi:putative sigma-54 modulation protein
MSGRSPCPPLEGLLLSWPISSVLELGLLRSCSFCEFTAVRGIEDYVVQVTISARHGHLSGTTQDKIREKLAKLPRLHDRLSSIQVTANLEKPEQIALEVRVKAERAEEFVAHGEGEELMAVLDGVIHKLEMQLRKHKEKVTDHKASGHKHVADELSGEPTSDE